MSCTQQKNTRRKKKKNNNNNQNNPYRSFHKKEVERPKYKSFVQRTNVGLPEEDCNKCFHLINQEKMNIRYMSSAISYGLRVKSFNGKNLNR